ncbi:MAG: hypothetical protein AAB489_00045 [Patescibacteria group bacterium]
MRHLRVIGAFLTVVFLLHPLSVFAVSVAISPGTLTDGGNGFGSWTNTSNAAVSDDVYVSAAKSGGVAENPIAKAAAEEQKRKEEWNASQLQSIPSETSKAFTLNQNRKTSEAQRRKALTLKTPERKGKINPSTHASSTLSPAQEKVCKRVEKRFENSPDALIKVQKRLELRFGAACP